MLNEKEKHQQKDEGVNLRKNTLPILHGPSLKRKCPHGKPPIRYRYSKHTRKQTHSVSSTHTQARNCVIMQTWKCEWGCVRGR